MEKRGKYGIKKRWISVDLNISNALYQLSMQICLKPKYQPIVFRTFFCVLENLPIIKLKKRFIRIKHQQAVDGKKNAPDIRRGRRK